MSTSSHIGKLGNDNNTVNYIYCHSDGYIEGVGKMLYDFYKKEEDVDKLLSLDDISFLGEIPEDDPELWKDISHSNKCRTYKGRGEESPSGTTDLEHYQYDSTPDYKYLFDKGEWLVYDKDNHTWVYLKDYFEKSEDESEEVEEYGSIEMEEDELSQLASDKVKLTDLEPEDLKYAGIKEDIENINKDYSEELQVGDKVVIKGLGENSPWEGLTGVIDWIDEDDFLDEFQTITVMVDFPVEGEYRKVLQNFDRKNVEKIVSDESEEEIDVEVEPLKESLKEYAIYGVDKDGNIKKERYVSPKVTINNLKKIGKRYLDKDESIINIYFSKFITNEEGEKQEIPLDSYTITRKGHDFDGVGKNLDESWGKYQDYDPKDGWTEEDIKKHKEVDWEARNWEELDVGDEFKGEVYIYRYDGGNEIKEATFHKFLRPNPIYPPYYKAIDFESVDLIGPMADGRKHKNYNIHDRYEDQKTYDMLSDSLHEDRKNNKISYEDALTKLNSGDWDNERFNDAIMDGEVEMPKEKSLEEEKKIKYIEMPHEVYTKPEDIERINKELDEKAKSGKLIPLRKEKDKLMLGEPEINGIWTIFLNKKGFIKKITLW